MRDDENGGVVRDDTAGCRIATLPIIIETFRCEIPRLRRLPESGLLEVRAVLDLEMIL